MSEFLSLWWVFPTSIAFATVAVGSGVSGAHGAHQMPGVLVGSTLGSRVGKWLPADLMEKVLGGVFAAVGALVLALSLSG